MTTNDLGLLQLGEDRAQRGHLIGCGERYREFEMSREPAIAGSQLFGIPSCMPMTSSVSNIASAPGERRYLLLVSISLCSAALGVANTRAVGQKMPPAVKNQQDR
jgi:hypothetical protein